MPLFIESIARELNRRIEEANQRGDDAIDIDTLFAEIDKREREHMQLIQIGYGKANFSKSSITIAGFHVGVPFVRTLGSKGLKKLGATIRTPVTPYPDIDGALYMDSLEAPEGTVFLIQTGISMRGSKVADGAVFIRTREKGPALLITAHIPHDVRCTLADHNYTVFSGRGDILTLDELAEEGFEIPEKYAKAYMAEDEVEECYRIMTIAKALEVKPVIERHVAEDGTEIALKIAPQRRKMRIRR